MSMPRRSRSRMATSVLQAGPMVQMILARRSAGFAGVDGSSRLLSLFGNLFLDEVGGPQGLKPNSFRVDDAALKGRSSTRPRVHKNALPQCHGRRRWPTLQQCHGSTMQLFQTRYFLRLRSEE